jgi:hypothetical protein
MKKLLSTLALATLMMTSTANAQLLQIDATCTGAIFDPLSDGNCAAGVLDVATDVINTDMPDIPVDGFADTFANATGYATAGLSDYSDNFELFLVSLNAGVGISAASGSGGGLDQLGETGMGVALMPSITVGLNMDMLPVDKLWGIDLKKMDVLFSFMSYDLNQDTSDVSFNGEITTFGTMFRYRMFEEVSIVPGKLVHWGGLHLHAGFRYSKFKAGVSMPLADQTTVDGGTSATYNFTNGQADFVLDNTVYTIPLEVSTYIRLAWATTFFGGLGYDLNFGDSKLALSGGGNITADGGGGNTLTGTVSSNALDGEGVPENNLRAFFGFQLNLPFVRLMNIKVNKSLTGDSENFGIQASLVKVLY